MFCFKIQVLIHLSRPSKPPALSYVSTPIPQLPGPHSLCLVPGKQSSMPCDSDLLQHSLSFLVLWLGIVVEGSPNEESRHQGFNSSDITFPHPLSCTYISGPQLFHLQNQEWALGSLRAKVPTSYHPTCSYKEYTNTWMDEWPGVCAQSLPCGWQHLVDPCIEVCLQSWWKHIQGLLNEGIVIGLPGKRVALQGGCTVPATSQLHPI